MPAADLDAGMVSGHECERDAEVVALAEQLVRIEQPEGEAEQRGVGREGDIALVPAQADAEGLGAIVLAAHDRADVAHGGRV
jgi:hypothetical protein